MGCGSLSRPAPRQPKRPEAMDFCEQNDIDFVFGLSGNGRLDRAVEIMAGLWPWIASFGFAPGDVR